MEAQLGLPGVGPDHAEVGFLGEWRGEFIADS